MRAPCIPCSWMVIPTSVVGMTGRHSIFLLANLQAETRSVIFMSFKPSLPYRFLFVGMLIVLGGVIVVLRQQATNATRGEAVVNPSVPTSIPPDAPTVDASLAVRVKPLPTPDVAKFPTPDASVIQSASAIESSPITIPERVGLSPASDRTLFTDPINGVSFDVPSNWKVVRSGSHAPNSVAETRLVATVTNYDDGVMVKREYLESTEIKIEIAQTKLASQDSTVDEFYAIPRWHPDTKSLSQQSIVVAGIKGTQRTLAGGQIIGSVTEITLIRRGYAMSIVITPGDSKYSDSINELIGSFKWQ